MAFDIDYFEGGCSVGWGGVVVCGIGIVGLGASVVNIVGVLDSVGDGKVPSTEIINHGLILVIMVYYNHRTLVLFYMI